MLDPVGVQMLQLNLVVVQQSPKERMGRNHESALMEGHERHDVAVGRCRHLLMTGYEALHRVGPPMEKATLDKALHACVGDVRAIPRLHGRQVWGNESFTDGGRARAEEQGFRWRCKSEGRTVHLD